MFYAENGTYIMIQIISIQTLSSKIRKKTFGFQLFPRIFYCYSDNDIMFLEKITQLGRVDDSCRYRYPPKSMVPLSIVLKWTQISENFYMEKMVSLILLK